MSNSVERWPAEAAEPMANVILPGLALAWASMPLTSVNGSLLLTAMASGALATSATAVKSFAMSYGGVFIVAGVVVKAEALNSSV